VGMMIVIMIVKKWMIFFRSQSPPSDTVSPM
jgi:hypothetical protein